MPRRHDSPLPDVRPWTVPTAAALSVVLMIVLILLVDVSGAFGGIDALAARGLAPPAVWFQMFQDRGVAEFLQWAAFGWFIILALTLRSWWWDRDADAARFWGLGAVFGMLLLVEDAGDVRDTIAHWGDAFLPGSRSGDITMVVWFGVIAAVLAVAVLRYGRRVLADRRTAVYGAAGVVAFAIASLGTAFDRLFGGLEPAGRWLVEDVFGAPHLVRLPGEDTDFLLHLIADFIIEEPLELLGAAFLVAAALAHARVLRSPDAPPVATSVTSAPSD